MEAAANCNTGEQQSDDWVSVCRINDVIDNIGICALLESEQVAVFKFSDGSLYAIDNYDPFSNANVISRGISGDLQGQPVVASPIYKQHFNLETGQCLEDESVTLTTYLVSVIDGVVHIARK